MIESNLVLVFTEIPTEEQTRLTNEYIAKMQSAGFKVAIGAPVPKPGK